MGRNFGVVDLEGKVDVVVDVAEGILGGVEAQVGALISLYWGSQWACLIPFVYTQKSGTALFSGRPGLVPVQRYQLPAYKLVFGKDCYLVTTFLVPARSGADGFELWALAFLF